MQYTDETHGGFPEKNYHSSRDFNGLGLLHKSMKTEGFRLWILSTECYLLTTGYWTHSSIKHGNNNLDTVDGFDNVDDAYYSNEAANDDGQRPFSDNFNDISGKRGCK